MTFLTNNIFDKNKLQFDAIIFIVIPLVISLVMTFRLEVVWAIFEWHLGLFIYILSTLWPWSDFEALWIIKRNEAKMRIIEWSQDTINEIVSKSQDWNNFKVTRLKLKLIVS